MSTPAPPVDLTVLLRILAQTWQSRADRYWPPGSRCYDCDKFVAETYRRAAEELTALLPAEETAMQGETP